MTQKNKNIIWLVVIIGVLITAPSLIISSIDTIRQSRQQDSRILRKYNFDDVFEHFKITDVKDIKISEEAENVSINIYGINFNPIHFTDKAELAKNLRNYVPYVDFFRKWPETMIAGGCDSLSADVSFKIQSQIDFHQVLMTIQDKCFGKAEISFTALNFNSEVFNAVKKDFLNLKFENAAKRLRTDDIKVSAVMRPFGKNYKDAALAQQSDIIGRDEDLKEKALQEYADFMKKNNVKSKAQDINSNALKNLLDITPARWEGKDVTVNWQIHFTEPITLNKALEFIPNMVLSIQ
jgi:hypothetical protein